MPSTVDETSLHERVAGVIARGGSSVVRDVCVLLRGSYLSREYAQSIFTQLLERWPGAAGTSYLAWLYGVVGAVGSIDGSTSRVEWGTLYSEEEIFTLLGPRVGALVSTSLVRSLCKETPLRRGGELMGGAFVRALGRPGAVARATFDGVGSAWFNEEALELLSTSEWWWLSACQELSTSAFTRVLAGRTGMDLTWCARMIAGDRCRLLVWLARMEQVGHPLDSLGPEPYFITTALSGRDDELIATILGRGGAGFLLLYLLRGWVFKGEVGVTSPTVRMFPEPGSVEMLLRAFAQGREGWRSEIVECVGVPYDVTAGMSSEYLEELALYVPGMVALLRRDGRGRELVEEILVRAGVPRDVAVDQIERARSQSGLEIIECWRALALSKG